MGVHPDDAHLPSGAAMVRGQAGDAARRQAVVAAEQDGDAAGVEDAAHRARHLAARGGDGLQEVRLRRAGVGGLGARALDVAEVGHVLEAGPAQRVVQAGQAHRRRAHVGPAPPAAQVQAHAGDGDGRPRDPSGHRLQCTGSRTRAAGGRGTWRTPGRQGFALTYFRSVCGPTSAAKMLPSASAVMPDAPEMRVASASARSGSGMKARSEPSLALPTVMPRT